MKSMYVQRRSWSKTTNLKAVASLVARQSDLFLLHLQPCDGLKAKMPELLPRSARPPGLLSRKAADWKNENRPEIEFSFSSLKVDEIKVCARNNIVFAIRFMLAWIFNRPLNSEKKFETSASLRSAMWFTLASICSQIQSKNSRALTRFARPCGLF